MAAHEEWFQLLTLTMSASTYSGEEAEAIPRNEKLYLLAVREKIITTFFPHRHGNRTYPTFN